MAVGITVAQTIGQLFNLLATMTDPIHRRLRRTLANKLVDFLQEGELRSEINPNDVAASEVEIEPQGEPVGQACNKQQLSLGYVRLTDAAPLIVASELGFFAEQGLTVSLAQESSWSSIRDKVITGVLDGAQMPATLPLACSLGAAGPRHTIVAPYTLSCGGNAITLSRQLFDELCTLDADLHRDMRRAGAVLKSYIQQRRQAGQPQLTLAMVFSTSTHNYLLRHWLALAGIDPDRDVKLIVIPPAQMADNLASGNIAGFCAGEPWNSKAIIERSGIAVATSSALWPGHPEKVLGLSQKWLQQNPRTARQLLQALYKASSWLSGPENRQSAAELLAKPEWLNQSADLLERSLSNQFQYSPGMAGSAEAFHSFGPALLNRPNSGAGLWWLAQMYRWGQLQKPLALTSAVATVFDEHVFNSALGFTPDTEPCTEAGPIDDRLRVEDPLQYLLDCGIGEKPSWLDSALSSATA